MSARDVIAKWSASKADRMQDIPYYDRADLIIAALDAAGYAVVPKKPTEAMINANDEIYWDYNCHVCGSLKKKWKAMLAAAKEKP